MKLLRTIRLDASDTFVYERAAGAGEWAVPGGFEFMDTDPRSLAGKSRQAFRAGFLGLTSCGWSTLVVAVAATPAERADAVEQLARYLMSTHGAPDLAAARSAAEAEITYASELADQPDGTLIALHRKVGDDGNLSEQFRTLRPAEARAAAAMPCSAGAFAVVDDDGATDPAAGEEIDFFGLGDRRGAGKP